MFVYRKTPSRWLFEIANYFFLTFLSVTIILPFVNVIAVSLSSKYAIEHFLVTFYPVGFNLEAYREIMGNLHFWRTTLNTIVLSVINTVLTLGISLLTGYALNSRHFVGKKLFSNYLLVPSYFSGGLIPFYLVVNGLGLNDKYLALILPVIAATGQIIIMRAAISQMPQELMDAAEVDGAGDVKIILHVVFPIILPVVAAFGIFTVISHWNDWFNCLLFIRDRNKWTLQFKLREIMTSNEMADDLYNPLKSGAGKQFIHPDNLKMAALMTTVLPVIAVYPALQKYWIKGIIIGAVKA